MGDYGWVVGIGVILVCFFLLKKGILKGKS
jgi:hypothetical protein